MKCLIVDDETLIRKSLGRALRMKNHTTMEAECGLQGLDLWMHNDFDLVFLDLVLPDISGIELVHRRGPQAAKIFFMTAFSQEAGQAIQRFHPAGFLKKPFEDIFAVIQLAEEAVGKTA